MSGKGYGGRSFDMSCSCLHSEDFPHVTARRAQVWFEIPWVCNIFTYSESPKKKIREDTKLPCPKVFPVELQPKNQMPHPVSKKRQKPCSYNRWKEKYRSLEKIDLKTCPRTKSIPSKPYCKSRIQKKPQLRDGIKGDENNLENQAQKIAQVTNYTVPRSTKIEKSRKKEKIWKSQKRKSSKTYRALGGNREISATQMRKPRNPRKSVDPYEKTWRVASKSQTGDT